MKKNHLIPFAKKLSFWTMTCLTLSIILCSCSKDDDNLAKDSTTLCQAIIDEDQSVMIDLMAELTQDLSPIAISTDPLGHQANLNTLIQRLNDFDCLTATEICYGCIQTLPVQSEIRVNVDLDGTQLERVMDISTPEDGVLRYLDMHE